MLHLIYGHSGSGKSRYLISLIEMIAGNKCYMLVPEQQAFLCERAVFTTLPPSVVKNLSVVNFSLLAKSVFSEYGGVSYKDISKGERSLIMWQNIRELSPLLSEYSAARSDVALSEMMLKLCDEFKVNGITPAMLEVASKKLGDSAFGKRLCDISLIYSSFEALIEECLENSANDGNFDDVVVKDTLERLCELLDTEARGYFKGAKIYIDSFTDFTAEEYDVIKRLLREAELYVTICADSPDCTDMHLRSSLGSASKLRAICNTEGIKYEEILLPASPRSRFSELNALERKLWRFESDSESDCGENRIELIKCADSYSELEMAALKILSLVQSGMRYRDIALVMRETEGYSGIIESVFGKYSIPYFVSEHTDLSSRPLCKHILCALRAKIYNMRKSDMLTLMRTGFFGITEEESDMFEEYCFTWNINGNIFLADRWSYNPDGYTSELSERGARILEAANSAKDKMIPPLLRFFTSLEASNTFRGKSEALINYLNGIGAFETQKELARSVLESENFKEAGEEARLCDFIISSLDSASSLMGEREFTTEEYLSALELIFSQTDIASVPAVLDYVTVGSASVLRVENIKVSILIGLNDGEFPQDIRDSGLLSENDKQSLESLGLQLKSIAQTRSSDELFFIYRAMTKPSERLILSYSVRSAGGKTRLPSSAYKRVASLFPYIKEQDISKINISKIVSGKSEKEGENTEKRISSDRESLWLSQSRIERFLACPYSYYASYTLSLRETKEAKLSFSDTGIYIHFVLREVMEYLSMKEGDRKEKYFLTDTEFSELTKNISDLYIKKTCPGLSGVDDLSPRLKHRFTKLCELTSVLISDLIEEFSDSRFDPAFFELPIGLAGENAIDSYKIFTEDGKKITLGGQVDRIDIWKNDGKIYLRVVDYKSGSKPFSIEDVKNGSGIQIILYLMALCQSDDMKWKKMLGDAEDDVIPAGAVYLSIENKDENGKKKPTPKRNGIILDDGKVIEALSLSGRLSMLGDVKKNDSTYSGKILKTANEIEEIFDCLKETVKGVAKEIFSGRIDRTPSADACKFCIIKNNCSKAYKSEL